MSAVLIRGEIAEISLQAQPYNGGPCQNKEKQESQTGRLATKNNVPKLLIKQLAI